MAKVAKITIQENGGYVTREFEVIPSLIGTTLHVVILSLIFILPRAPVVHLGL